MQFLPVGYAVQLFHSVFSHNSFRSGDFPTRTVFISLFQVAQCMLGKLVCLKASFLAVQEPAEVGSYF